MLTRLYLRASTDEQDARAKSALERFATEHGLTIAAFIIAPAAFLESARLLMPNSH